MNTRTDNTENIAEEFRQAARRLGRGAIYLAKAIPLGTTVKRLDRGATVMIVVIFLAGKLAINILRYSIGIAIYGLIIWPYRILAPLTAVLTVAAGTVSNLVEDEELGDQEDDQSVHDNPMMPIYIDNWTGEFTASANDAHRPNQFGS